MHGDTTNESVAYRNKVQRAIIKLGEMAWGQWDELRHSAAVVGTVLSFSVKVRNWTAPVRNILMRQILAIAVEPLGFVSTLAAFVGISVVVQLTFWVGQAGQSQLLGPLLVTVVARELGPVLINLVVIVRSGSAMTNELGHLQCSGGVSTLEAQRSDPFLHLVVPRVLSMAISSFCLTIVFILIAFTSGYLFSAWIGGANRDLFLFVDRVSRAIQPKDVIGILAKSTLPALFASACFCIAGLGVCETAADIPDATQRALTRSVVGMFVISVGISLLTYL